MPKEEEKKLKWDKKERKVERENMEKNEKK
jgi:hypothetical protein